MVSQERQHPALIWRTTHPVIVALGEQPDSYWELVKEGEPSFAHQYATIRKKGKRKWELEIWRSRDILRGMERIVTYHRSLTEAKAVGLVNVKFNQAQGK